MFNNRVLFIQGVKESDLYNRNLSLVTIVDSNSYVPHKYCETVPNEFIDIESWPKQVNFRCKSCTLSFSSIPFPLAIRTKHSGAKFAYDVVAYFCSLVCANRYNYKNFERQDAILNERRTISVYNEHFAQF